MLVYLLHKSTLSCPIAKPDPPFMAFMALSIGAVVVKLSATRRGACTSACVHAEAGACRGGSSNERGLRHAPSPSFPAYDRVLCNSSNLPLFSLACILRVAPRLAAAWPWPDVVARPGNWAESSAPPPAAAPWLAMPPLLSPPSAAKRRHPEADESLRRIGAPRAAEPPPVMSVAFQVQAPPEAPPAPPLRPPPWAGRSHPRRAMRSSPWCRRPGPRAGRGPARRRAARPASPRHHRSQRPRGSRH